MGRPCDADELHDPCQVQICSSFGILYLCCQKACKGSLKFPLLSSPRFACFNSLARGSRGRVCGELRKNSMPMPGLSWSKPLYYWAIAAGSCKLAPYPRRERSTGASVPFKHRWPGVDVPSQPTRSMSRRAYDSRARRARASAGGKSMSFHELGDSGIRDPCF